MTDTKNTLFKKILVLAALAVVVGAGAEKIVLAKGNSIPYTVLWKAKTAYPAQDDFVTFSMSHEIIGDTPALLTKKVVCDEGRKLSLVKDEFFCDSQSLGGYLTETWDGKPLTPFNFAGAVPKGTAFVMGTHERSFDSRYFGFIEKSELTVVKGLI